jgi:hypothetical protein
VGGGGFDTRGVIKMGHMRAGWPGRWELQKAQMRERWPGRVAHYSAPTNTSPIRLHGTTRTT